MFPFTLYDLLICVTVVIKVVFRNATEAGFEIYMGPLLLNIMQWAKWLKRCSIKCASSAIMRRIETEIGNKRTTRIFTIVYAMFDNFEKEKIMSSFHVCCLLYMYVVCHNADCNNMFLFMQICFIIFKSCFYCLHLYIQRIATFAAFALWLYAL